MPCGSWTKCHWGTSLRGKATHLATKTQLQPCPRWVHGSGRYSTWRFLPCYFTFYPGTRMREGSRLRGRKDPKNDPPPLCDREGPVRRQHPTQDAPAKTTDNWQTDQHVALHMGPGGGDVVFNQNMCFCPPGYHVMLSPPIFQFTQPYSIADKKFTDFGLNHLLLSMFFKFVGTVFMWLNKKELLDLQCCKMRLKRACLGPNLVCRGSLISIH